MMLPLIKTHLNILPHLKTTKLKCLASYKLQYTFTKQGPLNHAPLFYLNFLHGRTLTTITEKIDPELQSKKSRLITDNFKELPKLSEKDKDFIIALKGEGKSWSEINGHFPNFSLYRLKYYYSAQLIKNKRAELEKEKEGPFSNPDYKGHFWSNEEEQLLIESVGRDQSVYTIQKKHFPYKQIQSIVAKLDRMKHHVGGWTQKELMLLDEAYKKYGGDYASISAFVGTRSNAQCKQKLDYYGNELVASKSRRKWTEMENKKLAGLVETHGKRNWELISREFGLERSKTQLKSHYAYHLDPSVNKEPWTAREDEELIKAFTKFGPHRWKEISLELSEFKRNPLDCSFRWSLVNPFLRSGDWDQSEIELLEKYATYFQYKWSMVSKSVGSRTPYACEKKWFQLNYPDFRSDPWSEEETKKLIELFDELGMNWYEIATRLGTRTPSSCRVKYRQFSSRVHKS